MKSVIFSSLGALCILSCGTGGECDIPPLPGAFRPLVITASLAPSLHADIAVDFSDKAGGVYENCDLLPFAAAYLCRAAGLPFSETEIEISGNVCTVTARGDNYTVKLPECKVEFTKITLPNGLSYTAATADGDSRHPVIITGESATLTPPPFAAVRRRFPSALDVTTVTADLSEVAVSASFLRPLTVSALLRAASVAYRAGGSSVSFADERPVAASAESAAVCRTGDGIALTVPVCPIASLSGVSPVRPSPPPLA